MMTSSQSKILEACQHVFNAMEKTKIPAKAMPELAEALYLLRAVVASVKMEDRRNLTQVKNKH